MSTGKKILLTIALLMIIAVIVGYSIWNKPHTQVEDVSGVEVTVEQLVADYDNDETAANEKYLDKAIQVSGTVTGTEENQDGNTLVIMDEDVQCTMKNKDINISEGDKVTIKGFCSGANLFGIVLSECIIVK